MSQSIAAADPTSLRDHRILVVGGTSGIGLAAARRATAAGGDVIVLGRESSKSERVATENGFAGWRAADVLTPKAITAALADIPEVDHLVVLTGSFVTGKVLEVDIDQMYRAFDERVWAAVHVLRTLGERLASDGSVTFVSGMLADRPTAQGNAVIAAAAAAMEALARGLALELAPRRVNTVSPGATDTPLLEAALGSDHDGILKAMGEKIPIGRVNTADEVAAAILFLMQNRSMNAATLHIDGGARLV